jgi:hypothetical protein
MKVLKIALLASVVSFSLPACTNNEGVTRAELDEVREMAKRARACCESNTARVDRMFEKAMAK